MFDQNRNRPGHRSETGEVAALNQEIVDFLELIGSSPRFMWVLENVRTVASADCAVRIQGEMGTGSALLEEERSSALILDLKDGRLVDEEAVKLLAIQESNGTKLNNYPRYIREWIKREREAT